jgi:Aspartyl protease
MPFLSGLAAIAMFSITPAATQGAPAAASASGPRPAEAAPDAVIPLERWRTRWTMRLTVGGAERRMLFDTGGGLTMLSRPALEAAGCQPWGRLTGFRMFGDRIDTARCSNVSIRAGGLTLDPPAVGLIDLGSLNPADASLEGLASLNLFEGRTVTLDLAGGRVIVESPASLAQRIRTMRPIPIRLEREVQGLALAVAVEVPTARGPVWMELDSGNGGTVLVSKQLAPLFGLDPAVGGRQTARFPIVDGVTVETTDAFTPDIVLDGNLGMPFLSRWLITLDLREGRAWIAPAPAA